MIDLCTSGGFRVDAHKLTRCQEAAYRLLRGHENIFLTGAAGTGKSTLVRKFLDEDSDPKTFPVLASTGAAAILVAGRTFHSFFGLGIMQGGWEQTVERALGNKRVVRRLKKTRGIIIDEVSMLSAETLRAAESIARLARGKTIPWGGLRVIAVGDFCQLPPVQTNGQPRDWAFLGPTWSESHFVPAVLNTIVRTKEKRFLEVLRDIRSGMVTREVETFLNEKTKPPRKNFSGTRLFPLRRTTEQFNLEELKKVPGKMQRFPTVYSGKDRFLEALKKNCPIPEILHLKEGALVMIRINDPAGRFVNGTIGKILTIFEKRLRIETLSGLQVDLDKQSFGLLDAEGKEQAAAENFPVNLAYATTIHKAQGLTLDRVLIDLERLWEPGQAYVALSRVSHPKGLFLRGWSKQSIQVDPQVVAFYAGLEC